MSFAVVLDTNVLYSPTLRDTVLRLAEASLFTPLWSPHILDEVRAVLTRVGVPVVPDRRDVRSFRGGSRGRTVTDILATLHSAGVPGFASEALRHLP